MTESQSPDPSASPAPRRNPGLTMISPPWLIWGSRISVVVAVLGTIWLGISMTRRLKARVVTERFPTLGELVERDTVTRAPFAPALVAGDSLGNAAAAELARGRFTAAEREYATILAMDSTRASAAVARSLLAAWRGDDDAARASAALADRHGKSLPPLDRARLEAHRRWLDGDIPGSDSLWRRLLKDDPKDPTSWYAAAFVQLQSGGWVDTGLVAYGPPVQRQVKGVPTHRISTVDAEPTIAHVLKLAPGHEGAVLQAARFAAMRGDRTAMERLVWWGERNRVEPLTRLTLAALSADLKNDTLAWKLVKTLAREGEARDAFTTARIVASSTGLRSRLALWHAADLLGPFTEAGRDSAVVASAFAWRGMLLFAAERFLDGIDEARRGAAFDPATALPTASFLAWLAVGTPELTLRELRAQVAAWTPAPPPAPGAPRSPFAPHAAMGAHLKAYSLGLLDLALADYGGAGTQALAIDKLGEIPGEPGLAESMSAALRADVALAKNDPSGAMTQSERVVTMPRPLAREFSPFLAQLHPRYRRGVALQQGWRNADARMVFVTFFSPTVPELAVYRAVLRRFELTP